MLLGFPLPPQLVPSAAKIYFELGIFPLSKDTVMSVITLETVRTDLD